ncbi:type II toxin-antitoxin system RelE/ParE family toxin [Saccharibacillus sacchari]|uniref:type II toxin-antitoxin system RelE/ParE family toxin n=1 Tax=Saccharibacillus sacchari TaxID=456493 RepID=UPI000A0497CB|nr:type II toxin-antitoxin system RelE/ParE family toxin [Saccharibacillus sacchari]
MKRTRFRCDSDGRNLTVNLVKLLEAITAIRTDPFCGSPKSGDLKGIYGYDVFYKGTNYELAYRLEENEEGEIVVVILAGTRENFYDELKRYLNM